MNVRSRILRAGLALLLTLTCLGAPLAHPNIAFGSIPPYEIVPDESFAPEGYDWSFNFESVEIESGFEYVENISKHYSRCNIHDPETGFYDCVGENDAGYAAYIYTFTDPIKYGTPVFQLRFKNGTYQGEKVDAVVALTDWNLITASSINYWMVNDPGLGVEDFAYGVFYNPNYTNDSRYRGQESQPSLNNMNFYLMGINELEVQISFYRAGTNDPIDVKGHMTAIDLDRQQGIAIREGFTKVEISERSTHTTPEGGTFLSFNENQSRFVAGNYGISANDSDGYYACGLVGGYFDTAGGTPLRVLFFSPWRGSNNPLDGGLAQAMSFFALTPEYVANPSITSIAKATKSVDRADPVVFGEEVTYRIDIATPAEGADCRIGYRYAALAVIDEIDPCLDVAASSLSVLRDGKQLTAAGSFTRTGDDGAIEFAFDETYLAKTPLVGQTYSIEFRARVARLPDPNSEGRYLIPNDATVLVNGTAEVPTNVVYVEVANAEPRDIVVTKRIPADVFWAHGEPAFLFELSGANENGVRRTYRKLVAFSPESATADGAYLSVSTVFEGVDSGTYTLAERTGLRYELESIDTNGATDGSTVTFDLAKLPEPEATFTNGKTSNYGGSDAASTVNEFRTVRT